MTTLSRRITTRLAIGAAAAALIAVPTAAQAAGTPSTSSSAPAASTTKSAKPTIVLVHGAWADASSFAPVVKRLQADGYTVVNAPNPLRGLSADAASLKAFIEQATTGPVVLVGHSYGGAVITNAATGITRVTDLVYVDAFAPDKGETIVQLSGAKPGSALAADPKTVFDAVQDPNLPDGDPDLYIKRNLFRSIFAAKMDAKDAAVLAASQSPIAGGALQEPSGDPAWKTIPSWFAIGASDKVIPAAEQRAMAARAHGRTTTLRATDHLSMLEAPTNVANLIETAAKTK
ncbi:alpha/beta hydrolase [Curtobacterium flaccumfaciens pv. flaccumfaciens]|uniref:alpha/beta fold hydrolase n=1 Tax=Curtobacterium flaccumfaciens TaxID=2035 RepID=UPI00217CC636|nr:alpha/beta hydrolase [Curtobacterium flaccumfaciens]MCS6568015.1 alpha/beta hydrolase [Curtobacterium flaccumfaciens pv. flaccumfaciens]MCS6584117.1 alpha/beta hydrolase [Curtobacterium flaccumfaciens pv. flaccumfaciens]